MVSCLKNQLANLNDLLEILSKNFADNFYIEIQRQNNFREKEFENYLCNISAQLNLPLIASQEVFYLRQDMAEAQDALLCIKNKVFIEDKNKQD